jgi:hypothetical protein
VEELALPVEGSPNDHEQDDIENEEFTEKVLPTSKQESRIFMTPVHGCTPQLMILTG